MLGWDEDVVRHRSEQRIGPPLWLDRGDPPLAPLLSPQPSVGRRAEARATAEGLAASCAEKSRGVFHGRRLRDVWLVKPNPAPNLNQRNSDESGTKPARAALASLRIRGSAPSTRSLVELLRLRRPVIRRGSPRMAPTDDRTTKPWPRSCGRHPRTVRLCCADSRGASRLPHWAIEPRIRLADSTEDPNLSLVIFHRLILNCRFQTRQMTNLAASSEGLRRRILGGPRQR